MAGQSGEPGGMDEWQTSDTFLGDVYSGEPERLSAAFKRFVEVRLPMVLSQIRKALPSHRHSEAEDVAQNVLIELHKDILSKGWRHPPGTRFRQCVGQLAKDAISEAKRRMSRRREVEMSDALLEPTCSDLVDGFWRTEVLRAAESRVQSVKSVKHWQVYVAWKAREGMTSGSGLNELTHNPGDGGPLSDNDRQIVARIRAAVREEIERIAERGGFEPRELLLEGP